MDEAKAPEILGLLSNDLRWNILKELAASDLRVQEICQRLGQPQNLVSYHLQKLRDHSLVREHQSIADGRETYYGINLSEVREQIKAAGDLLHASIFSSSTAKFPTAPLRVLFICTHNSARSQMAEGLLRSRSRNQIQAFSAGVDPLPVNTLAARVMAEMNVDIRYQRSKSLEQFLDQRFDYIITVCDRARENCPAFPANPTRIHWSIADPVTDQETTGDPLQPFRDAAGEISERVDHFLSTISR
ncbi:MAG TPA: helix-turn-helix domain-containing protein [Anaerolineaceae bacterium]|nr:helix-turn-helix domain-containing protein [Anaerolineaceae bacterium]